MADYQYYGAKPPAHLSGAELGPERYNMYKNFLSRYGDKMIGFPEDIYSDTSPASRLASDEYNYRINSAQPYIQGQLEQLLGEGRGGNTGAKYGSQQGSLASILRQVQNDAMQGANQMRSQYGTMIANQAQNMRQGADTYNAQDVGQMNTFANFMKGLDDRRFKYEAETEASDDEFKRGLVGAGIQAAMIPFTGGGSATGLFSNLLNRGGATAQQATKAKQAADQARRISNMRSGMGATQLLQDRY